MFITYDGWIRNQHDFDFYNRINDYPLTKWDGTTGPYHQLVNKQIRARLENLKNAHPNSELIRHYEEALHREEKLDHIETIPIKQGEFTMQVSYSGFTGELVKLERNFDIVRNGIAYDLDIRDHEKEVTYSFDKVKLSDVKFLNGVISFGE